MENTRIKHEGLIMCFLLLFSSCSNTPSLNEFQDIEITTVHICGPNTPDTFCSNVLHSRGDVVKVSNPEQDIIVSD